MCSLFVWEMSWMEKRETDYIKWVQHTTVYNQFTDYVQLTAQEIAQL